MTVEITTPLTIIGVLIVCVGVGWAIKKQTFYRWPATLIVVGVLLLLAAIASRTS